MSASAMAAPPPRASPGTCRPDGAEGRCPRLASHRWGRVAAPAPALSGRRCGWPAGRRCRSSGFAADGGGFGVRRPPPSAALAAALPPSSSTSSSSPGRPLRSPWLVVGMTSLPSRIPGIVPALSSVAVQERRPDRLVLSLPRTSRREGRGYELPAALLEVLQEHPWMEVHWMEEDFGPGTKILGALDWLAAHANPCSDDVLMVLDDDHEYSPHALGDLLHEQSAQGQEHVSTYFAYFFRGMMVPQGADIIAVPLGEGLVDKLPAYHRAFVAADRDCFLVDDLWIGMFFFMCGRSVTSCRDMLTARGLQMIYRRTSNASVAALEALGGDDRRDRVMLRAFGALAGRLLAAGPGGLGAWGGEHAWRRMQRLHQEVQQVEARIEQLAAWTSQQQRCSPASSSSQELVGRAAAELAKLRHLYQMQAPPPSSAE